MKTRVQLSLYAPPSSAGRLEAARRLLDPIQAALIPAHVTLCRDDELQAIDLAELGSVIVSSGARPITLRFGSPEIFQGHGVVLRCIAGEEEFQALRCRVLGSRTVRPHVPHITVAHPRNPRAPQNMPSNFSTVPDGLVVTFNIVRHIRQLDDAAWQVIAAHSLAGGPSSALPNAA